MNILDLDKIKDYVDEMADKAMNKVEWVVEKSKEYNDIFDEVCKLEQQSEGLTKLIAFEPTTLNENDIKLYIKYYYLEQDAERLGWKYMYIQGIKDSLNVISKLIELNKLG